MGRFFTFSALALITSLFARQAFAEVVTAPVSDATAAPATGATADVLSDYGKLDLEMATVSDFNQLDLATLLDAEVITASKKSERISQAPAIIEVLTRKQLKDLGARDLYQALTFLPGIELLESYNGYTTLIFRGQSQEIYNAKILFLMNGHPVYEVANSSFQLEMVPIESIERVEVIRGPGSVLYGTNAFAGVINVITSQRGEDGQSSRARFEGGSFQTGAASGGNYGRRGDFTWNAFVGANYTKGYAYVVETDQNEDCLLAKPLLPSDCPKNGPSASYDYFNNYANAYADVSYAGLRLQAGGLFEEKQKYSIIPVARFHESNQFNPIFAELSYKLSGEIFSFTAKAGLNKDKHTWGMGTFPLPGAKYEGVHADASTMLIRGEVVFSITPLEELEIDTGLSYDFTGDGEIGDGSFAVLNKDGSEHALSPNFKIPPKQHTESLYGQATWRPLESLAFIVGDRVSQFQTDRNQITLNSSGIPVQKMVSQQPSVNNSARGGVVYTPFEALTLKALYGTAYRLPNLYETAGVLNQVLGTTPLEPETIRTAELGIDSRPTDRLSLRLNGFNSLTDQIIGRRPPTAAEVPLFGKNSTVYDNVPGQRILGVEAAAHSILNDQWSLFANGSWKRVINRKSRKFEHFTSPFIWNGGVSYQPVAWFAARPNAQYFGARDSSHAYVLANAVLDFPIYESVTISLIGNNLLDQKYTYPEYVRQVVETTPGGPGRAFYGRVTADF